ncbi:MAG: hypothetical protein M9916_00640 [Crocinitomicaceae bacterium]|nr:hypothetical protein [Crocinitomicaceae bacterium]
MLDLNLLEKKLDEALQNETVESMTTWLSQRRLKELFDLMGEGNIEALPTSKTSFNQTNDIIIKSNTIEMLLFNDDYFFAA